MKVRMKTCARSPDFRADIGQEIEVSDEYGAVLVEGGFAEPVEVEEAKPDKEVEEATVQPPEHAVSRGRGRRRSQEK